MCRGLLRRDGAKYPRAQATRPATRSAQFCRCMRVLGIYSDRFADASGTIPPPLMSIGRIRESLPSSAHRVGPVGDEKDVFRPIAPAGRKQKGSHLQGAPRPDRSRGGKGGTVRAKRGESSGRRWEARSPGTGDPRWSGQGVVRRMGPWGGYQLCGRDASLAGLSETRPP